MKIFICMLGVLLSFCGTPKSNQGEEIALLALLPQATTTDATSSTSCPPSTIPDGILLADTVTYALAVEGSAFGDSSKMTGAICGAGENSGGVDVFSLAQTGDSSYVVLEWAGKSVSNISGTDFIVYENPFNYSSGSGAFMEPIIVEVSRDNSTWCGFPINYKGSNGDKTAYSQIASDWEYFAGLTPVTYNMTTSTYTSSDLFAGSGGGDSFDLDNLTSSSDCSAAEVSSIQASGFTYLRLTAASARTNSDTGSAYPTDSGAFGGGPDIDGVIANQVTDR
ncbi:MAG: LIC_13355 family lipoprotein [Spirochaetota bacterium]